MSLPQFGFRLRKGLVGLAGVATFGLLGLAFSARLVMDPPQQLWFPTDATADLALVLSGDPGEQRTRAATRLLLKARVDHLLISGRGYGGDSAELLAQTAYALGAAPEKVWVESQAQTTFENLDLSLKLLKRRDPGLKTLVIITGQTHMARAGLVAERLAPHLRVWVLPVPEPLGYRVLLRESVALWVYAWRGHLRLW